MRNLLLFIFLFLTVGLSAQSRKHRQMYDEIAQICRVNDCFNLMDFYMKNSVMAKQTRDSVAKYNVEYVMDKFTVKGMQDSAYSKFSGFSEDVMVSIKSMLSNPALAVGLDFNSIIIIRSDSEKVKEILEKLNENSNAEVSPIHQWSADDLKKAAKTFQLLEKLNTIGRQGEEATVEPWGGYSSNELRKAADDMKYLEKVKFLGKMLEAIEEAPSKVIGKLVRKQNSLLKSKGVDYRVR